MIEIPLRAGVENAHQRFTQRLGQVLAEFRVDYVSYANTPYWVMSVFQDGAPIAQGIPLNAGADLLANQDVGDFGVLVFVGEEATLDNLGIANNLVWLPSDE